MTLPGKFPKNLSNIHSAYTFIFNLQQKLGQEQMEQRLQSKVKYMKINFQVLLFCDLFSRRCVGEYSIFWGYEAVAIISYGRFTRQFHLHLQGLRGP